MATNLVAQITEALAPALVDRIASGLGLNKTITQKAIVAAIPALLGALISYVSKPQGAAKLNDVVRKQEPGLLSSLANVVGGSGQKALIDQGSSVLTALLGKKILSGLEEAYGSSRTGGPQYPGTRATGSGARRLRACKPADLPEGHCTGCIAFRILQISEPSRHP
jgi:hypothetical protein